MGQPVEAGRIAASDEEPNVVVPRMDDVLMSDVLKGKVSGLDEENARRAERLAASLIMAQVILQVPKVDDYLALTGTLRGMRSCREKGLVLELKVSLSDAYALTELHFQTELIGVRSVATSQGDDEGRAIFDCKGSQWPQFHLFSIEMCDVDHEHDTCTLLLNARSNITAK